MMETVKQSVVAGIGGEWKWGGMNKWSTEDL